MKKYFWSLPAVFTIVLLLGTFLTAPTSSQDKASLRIDELMAGVQGRMDKVQFGQGYFVRESFFNGDQRLLSAVEDEQIQKLLQKPPLLLQTFWAADAEGHVREDVKYQSLGSDKSVYEMSAFDGVNYWSYQLGSSVATKNDSYAPNEIPLGEVMGWLQLLHQNEEFRELTNDGRLKYIGEKTLGGIKTQQVESIPQENERSIKTWWIAPELDYLIVKSEVRPTLKQGKFRLVRRFRIVDKVLRKDGVFIPVQTREVIVTTIDEDKSKEYWEWINRFSVVSFTTKKDGVDSLFHFPLPIGTKYGEQSERVGGDMNPYWENLKKGVTKGMLSEEPLSSLSQN